MRIPQFVLGCTLAALMGGAAAITPTPPTEVVTEFKAAQGTVGVLYVQAVVHQRVKNVHLQIETPRGFELKVADGKDARFERKEVGDKRVEYRLLIAEEHEKGKLTIGVEVVAPYVSERQTWPIEVRVLATLGEEPGGLAIAHQSLIATVTPGSLNLQTPELFQRERRIEAEKIVREMAQKEPGFNLDNVLADAVEKVDPRRLSKKFENEIERNVLEVLPSGLSDWERQVYIDRSELTATELDPITVRGRAFYFDFDGVLRPLVNATIRVMDDDWGPDEHITSTITGWDGRFSTVVNNNDGWFQDGRDIYIRIRASNSRFRVEDCSYWPDWTYTWRANDGSNLSDGTIVDFGSFSLAGSTNARRAAMVFQRMNSAWNRFTGAGDQDPGFVDACYPDSPTHYDTFWEEIDIAGSDFDSRDIIVHEWGHAIQDNAQWLNAWSGATHSFCGLTNREQAFVEGWATFVALETFPDNRFNWNPGDSGRELENYSCAGSRSTANGPRDEGRIAATLLDLRDASNDCNNGCGSSCDSNSTNRVGLDRIWDDAMWGTIGILTDDAFEFWRELCPAVTAAQRPLAVDIHDFNCIDVAPCTIPSEVLAKVAPEELLRGEDVYAHLERLRTELKTTESGRALVDGFFRNAPALVELAERDERMMRALVELRDRLALAALWITSEDGRYEQEVPVSGELLAAFELVSKGLREHSKEGLADDVSHMGLVLRDLEGRTVSEIRSKLQTSGRRK